MLVNFDSYISALERGLDDRDIVVDADDIIYETASSTYRSEADINKKKRSGKANRREFALPIDYSLRQSKQKRTLQEMSPIIIDDTFIDNPDEKELEIIPTPKQESIVVKPPISVIDEHAASAAHIDLISLSEAAELAPQIAMLDKSLFVPFALELVEINTIKNGCIPNEVWGEMCPVEICGAGGLKHTVNLPSTSGVYVAPKYMSKQLGDIFILRNSSFTMDLMMRRDSGQIEIGHKLESPNGMVYGTVIHYGTIASKSDPVGEVWMLVQRITDGWHIPTPIKPVRTVLTGSTHINKLSTPKPFDATRTATKEITVIQKQAETKTVKFAKPDITLSMVARKGFDTYPQSIY